MPHSIGPAHRRKILADVNGFDSPTPGRTVNLFDVPAIGTSAVNLTQCILLALRTNLR